jgi:hypothetical protein
MVKIRDEEESEAEIAEQQGSKRARQKIMERCWHSVKMSRTTRCIVFCK